MASLGGVAKGVGEALDIPMSLEDFKDPSKLLSLVMWLWMGAAGGKLLFKGAKSLPKLMKLGSKFLSAGKPAKLGSLGSTEKAIKEMARFPEMAKLVGEVEKSGGEFLATGKLRGARRGYLDELRKAAQLGREENLTDFAPPSLGKRALKGAGLLTGGAILHGALSGTSDLTGPANRAPSGGFDPYELAKREWMLDLQGKEGQVSKRELEMQVLMNQLRQANQNLSGGSPMGGGVVPSLY